MNPITLDNLMWAVISLGIFTILAILSFLNFILLIVRYIKGT